MFGPGLADPQTLGYIERLGGQTAVLQDQVSRSPYLLGLQTSRSTRVSHQRLGGRAP
jgi:hypothetical protein